MRHHHAVDMTRAPQQSRVEFNDASAVGEARRAAALLAVEAGLGEVERGRVAVVVTELGNNLVRHARGGALLLRAMADPAGVEVLAVDRGPGMSDLSRCLQDGYSTAGTSGTGLGAARRMATDFDVYTAVPSGTVIAARVLATTPPRAAAEARWGVASMPAPGERESGDAWCVVQRAGRTAVLVADGLGHGPLAAVASAAAVASFAADPFARPAALVERAHVALQGTRGAALAVAQLDDAAGVLRYAGVGNIAGTLADAVESRGLFSSNGTVGAQMRGVHEHEYPMNAGARLVMHSDGLNTRWRLAGYPGLASRHPSVIAGVLLRDSLRGRDDAAVVVVGRATGAA